MQNLYVDYLSDRLSMSQEVLILKYCVCYSCIVGYNIFSFCLVLQNVELLNGQTPDGNTYYEQYNAPCGVIRTGDCVYVRTDMGRQLVAQVDSVWTSKQ